MSGTARLRLVPLFTNLGTSHVIFYQSSLICIYFVQTTSVHALARQLLGTAYSNGVLELNASDSRGIDVSSFSAITYLLQLRQEIQFAYRFVNLCRL